MRFPSAAFRCHLRRLRLAIAAVALLSAARPAVAADRPGTLAVRVNATAQAPAVKGASFYLFANEPKNESTLLYAEVCRLVRAALGSRGLYEAPRRSSADVLVEIEYGMAAPRGKESRDAVGSRARELIAEDSAQIRSAIRGPLEKVLVLSAREARSKGDSPPRSLWRVELSITDTSNDFRRYLPVLATAAIDEMGLDSGGEKIVRLNEKSKTVLQLKQAK